LQPYCNVVTLAVTQNGTVFRLEGTDDQCGSGERASATGAAFPNPNGSIGIGLSIVSAPGGAPLHVNATISTSTFSGTWQDSGGNSGAFVLTPGAPVPGSPRSSGGGIGAAAVNPSQVQLRVAGVCSLGTAVVGINADGSLDCESTSVGEVTSVSAGAGLQGGGSSGSVALSVAFAGPGAAATAARSDHTHTDRDFVNTSVGPDALSSNENGAFNVAVGFNALGSNTGGDTNVAIGHSALSRNVATNGNIAIGYRALATLEFGNRNIAIGRGTPTGGELRIGNNNIYIANNGSAIENNTIRIGEFGTHEFAFIAGVRGVTVNFPATVVIGPGGQLGTISSTRRVKEDIADLGGKGFEIQRLRPVQFRYRQASADGSKPVQYGLIAEEVVEVLPELVAYDQQGRPETVMYHMLPALLVAEIQRLERERGALAASVELLYRDLALLRERIGEKR
jgi:hypothetical protein